jgi:ubiquinone/menaquinone biosynthesis C-methylase UbiE
MQDRWKGYYEPHARKAAGMGKTIAQVLDAEWYDSAGVFERLLLPKLVPGSRVLEIACGVGNLARLVAPRCAELCCADILEEALAEARRTLAGVCNVTFHRLSGYDLAGLASDRFDLVYSFTSFFHFDFELVVSYLGEIRRVLAPGGDSILEFKTCVTERAIDQLLRKIEQAGGVEKYERAIDKWRYVSKDALVALCAHFGLEVVIDDVTRFTFRKPAA